MFAVLVFPGSTFSSDWSVSKSPSRDSSASFFSPLDSALVDAATPSSVGTLSIFSPLDSGFGSLEELLLGLEFSPPAPGDGSLSASFLGATTASPPSSEALGVDVVSSPVVASSVGGLISEPLPSVTSEGGDSLLLGSSLAVADGPSAAEDATSSLIFFSALSLPSFGLSPSPFGLASVGVSGGCLGGCSSVWMD